jgi:hypothetical protein
MYKKSEFTTIRRASLNMHDIASFSKYFLCKNKGKLKVFEKT